MRTEAEHSGAVGASQDIHRDAQRSVRDLVRELLSEGQTMVRGELEAARAELRAEVRAGTRLARDFAIAGVLAHTALLALVAAAILLLSLAMQGWLAALLVGVAIGGVAAGLGYRAYSRAKELKAPKAPQHMKEDARWAKQTMRGAVSRARASA